MICFRAVLNAPPSRTGTPAGYTSGRRTDDRYPRAPAGGALAGRAAHEIKLVGDVDQLTRSQLPTAHGQPAGQVRRIHPILATPQRVPDRAKDAAQEVSLIVRVVPIRARPYDPVRRPPPQPARPRRPQAVKQAPAPPPFPTPPAVPKP